MTGNINLKIKPETERGREGIKFNHSLGRLFILHVRGPTSHHQFYLRNFSRSGPKFRSTTMANQHDGTSFQRVEETRSQIRRHSPLIVVRVKKKFPKKEFEKTPLKPFLVSLIAYTSWIVLSGNHLPSFLLTLVILEDSLPSTVSFPNLV